MNLAMDGPKELAPGQVVAGKLEVVRTLGIGGMGAVYEVVHAYTKHRRALKLLHRRFARQPEVVARFLREAGAAGRIGNPHVVETFDAGQLDTGEPYLLMELLQGEPLDVVLRREGRLAPAVAIDFVAQAADGVEAAHRAGIVHRDLKPANLFIVRGERPFVKVVDFGISKFEHRGSDPALTQDGALLGTPHYMSPEQVRGGREVDGRTDVYALGVVLYECLSGQLPFSASALPELSVRIHEGSHASLSELCPELPVQLASLVARAMERDLASRVQSAAMLASELRQIDSDEQMAQAPTLAVSPSSPEPAASSNGDPARDRDTPHGRRTLIVLPFANLSADPDNEYFSDGLTEEVIADLSSLEALRVTSRTSAMRFKGATKSLAEIGRELGVRYALEGSVRKAGTNLRITARLVDVASDEPLWSEKFRGTLDDVFEFQEQVSRSIVDALRIRLSTSEERRLAERPFKNAELYDLYLRAKRDIQSFSLQRLERARADLERALQTHGENVLIHRALAMAAWQMVNAGFSSDSRHLSEVEAHGQRILALDPAGPHGPAVMAYAEFLRGNTREALKGFSRSAELDPSDTECLTSAAIFWIMAGRAKEANAILERVEAIDPYLQRLHIMRGFAAYFATDFDASSRHMERAMELGAEHRGAPVLLVQSRLSLGDYRGAEALVRMHMPDPSAHPLASLGHVLLRAAAGDRAGCASLTTEPFLAAMWEDPIYAFSLAQARALAGEPDEAFRWIDRAVTRGLLVHEFFATGDPLLAALRADERFPTLIQRVQRLHAEFDVGV